MGWRSRQDSSRRGVPHRGRARWLLVSLFAIACGGEPVTTHEVARAGWAGAAWLVALGPSISGIQVVPDRVAVGLDPVELTSFRLEARMWSTSGTKRLGMTSGPDLVLEWVSAGDWLEVTQQVGDSAIISARAGTQPTTLARAKATAGGKNSSSPLDPVASPGSDELYVAYTAAAAPTVAVLHGTPNTTGACATTLLALVRHAAVGQLVGRCEGAGEGWGAAILDPNRALSVVPAPWTTGSDELDARSLQQAPRVLPVSLIVLVGEGIDPDKIRLMALADIQATNSTLAVNRVGVVLSAVDTMAQSNAGGTPTEVADCLTGDALQGPGDRPGILRLMYVNAAGAARGMLCAGTAAHPAPTIYVSTESASASTLVHEVGHALGLTLPGFGHAEDSPGLDLGNVMTDGLYDEDRLGRRQLTVGQAFRMNIDSASWLNSASTPLGPRVRESTALRLACQCGAQDPAGVCPRVQEDVAEPSGRPQGSQEWDCYDRLTLPDAYQGDLPVGILAGRRWRDPLGKCAPALVGTGAEQWEQRYVQFENVTRPGACASWASLFFRQYRVLYLPLAEGQGVVAWSNSADRRPIGEPTGALAEAGLLPPLKLTVRLFYAQGATTDQRVKRQVELATRVFGPDNRAGVELTFDAQAGVPCPTAPPAAGVVSVCYVSSPAEVAGTGPSLRLSASVATDLTLAHALGRALGLPVITNPADPAFASNVMQAAPADRGEHLTLGQVFRVHTTLRPGELPDCAQDATRCPPLTADGPP